MSSLPIVVIGASAGGLEPLKRVVRALPADFPGAVFVVLHVSASGPSLLPEILSRAGKLPAVHPEDGDPIRPGRIYVAPPDHHLLVEGGRVRVTKGPKENRFRPAIDALFRSAAYTHGPNVIGVVLSGLLDDGTSGLWTVKRLGGTAAVQDPGDADFDPMPRSALSQVEVDYALPSPELGTLVSELANRINPRRAAPPLDEHGRHRLEVEVRVAAGESAFELGVTRLGQPSLFTCPECQGVLTSFREGQATRFRCHTGHAFTANSLLAEVTGAVEEKLYQTRRALEETTLLLRFLGERAAEIDDPATAAQFREKAREVEDRTRVISEAALENERLCEEAVRAMVRPPRAGD